MKSPSCMMSFSKTLALKIGLNEAIAIEVITSTGGMTSMAEVVRLLPFWSDATVGRTVRRLRKLGMINVQKAFHPMDKTLYFTTNFSAVEAAIKNEVQL